VPLPPPQDDNNRIEKNESTDRNPVNRPSMHCPCRIKYKPSLAPIRTTVTVLLTSVCYDYKVITMNHCKPEGWQADGHRGI
jgi:hypothetical protein